LLALEHIVFVVDYPARRYTMDRIEEAWTEYQFGKMVDPAHRYEHDDRAIFRAGWNAAQRKNESKVESVWISVPVAPDDDPE
jgi:hypothetical protein